MNRQSGRGWSAEGVYSPPGEGRRPFLITPVRLAIGKQAKIQTPDTANILYWSVKSGILDIIFGDQLGNASSVPHLHGLGPDHPQFLPLPEQSYTITITSSSVTDELIATIIFGRM